MKRSIIVLFIFSVLAGMAFFVNRQKGQPKPSAEPVVEIAPSATAEATQAGEPIVSAPEQPAQPVAARVSAKPITPPGATVASPSIDASYVARAVDMLVSPQAGYQQKRDIWKQLRDTGKLD